MTSYAGIVYLFLFLPVVMLLYTVTKQKYRPFVLLLAGYAFFVSISGKLLIFLLFTTLMMYLVALKLEKIKSEMKASIKGLEKEEKKQVKARYKLRQKRFVVLFVLVNLGFIVVLKYSGFLIENIDHLLNLFHSKFVIPMPEFVVPIGISFYTLMSISYVMDVYNDVIKADHNFLRVALYMAYFPDLMEGPFTRYAEVAHQIYECKSITYENLTRGWQRILYGMFKKLMVVDRLNGLILNIYSAYEKANGGMVALGMVAYTIQLYCEFSGTMDIVLGSAEIFGVTLPENFKRPFFSRTISEFWTRWHITLGTWFKDYIYYPVSMSKSMKNLTQKARKSLGNNYGPLLAGTIALFFVWFANGLWHGSAWKYVFFGLYHFVLITIGNLMDPLMKGFVKRTGFSRDVWWYKWFQIVRTTILVCIGELIFRAVQFKAAIVMLKSMFTDFSVGFIRDGSVFTLGMDRNDYIVVIASLIVIFIMSLLAEKGIDIREKLAKKPIVVRWGLLYAIIIIVLVFGAYGNGYFPVDPIYAGF